MNDDALASNDRIERLARRRAGAKMGWYIHATVYVLVNLFLVILASSRGHNWAMYPLLGCSLEGALWFNFFAATGEFFDHSNFKSPPWLKYVIQTPELHSVHHELDVHQYNFADIPLWDGLFGTYRDTDSFAPACGFPNHNERHLGRMLMFRDVYNFGRETTWSPQQDDKQKAA